MADPLELAARVKARQAAEAGTPSSPGLSLAERVKARQAGATTPSVVNADLGFTPDPEWVAPQLLPKTPWEQASSFGTRDYFGREAQRKADAEQVRLDEEEAKDAPYRGMIQQFDESAAGEAAGAIGELASRSKQVVTQGVIEPMRRLQETTDRAMRRRIIEAQIQRGQDAAQGKTRDRLANEDAQLGVVAGTAADIALDVPVRAAQSAFGALMAPAAPAMAGGQIVDEKYGFIDAKTGQPAAGSGSKGWLAALRLPEQTLGAVDESFRAIPDIPHNIGVLATGKGTMREAGETSPIASDYTSLAGNLALGAAPKMIGGILSEAAAVRSLRSPAVVDVYGPALAKAQEAAVRTRPLVGSRLASMEPIIRPRGGPGEMAFDLGRRGVVEPQGAGIGVAPESVRPVGTGQAPGTAVPPAAAEAAPFRPTQFADEATARRVAEQAGVPRPVGRVPTGDASLGGSGQRFDVNLPGQRNPIVSAEPVPGEPPVARVTMSDAASRRAAAESVGQPTTVEPTTPMRRASAPWRPEAPFTGRPATQGAIDVSAGGAETINPRGGVGPAWRPEAGYVEPLPQSAVAESIGGAPRPAVDPAPAWRPESPVQATPWPRGEAPAPRVRVIGPGRGNQRGAIGFGGGRGPGGRGSFRFPGRKAPATPKTTITDPVAAEAVKRIDERIVYEEPGTPLSEKLSATGRAIRSFIRKEAPIKEFEKTVTGDVSPTGPTAQARYAQGSAAGKALDLFETGSLETRPVTPKSFRAALEEIGPDASADLTRYIVAKRHLTRYASRGLEFGGMDAAESAKIVRDIETTKPKIAEAAKTLDATNAHLMDRLAESGAITPQQLAKIRAENPVYYAPTEFVTESPVPGMTSGSSGPMSKVPLPKVKGTGDKAMMQTDPLPRVVEHWENMVQAIDNAETLKSVVETYDKNPGASPWFREVKTPSRFPDLDTSLADWKQRNAIKPGDPVPADSLGAFLTDYLEAGDKATRAITVNGKTRYFEFVGPEGKAFLEAMSGVPASAKSGIAGLLLKASGKVSKVFRAGTTLWPSFSLVTNPLRDIRSAIVMTTDKSVFPAQFVVDMAKSYAKTVASTTARSPIGKALHIPDVLQGKPLRAAGAEGLIAQDRPAMRKTIRQITNPTKVESAKAAAIEGVQELASIMESGPRIAEYENVLRRHGYKMTDTNIPRSVVVEASNAAANVTTPFKLGSRLSKDVSQVLPFFNPRQQGTYSLLEMAKKRPLAFALRVAAIDTIPRIALWMKNKDEKWYKDMPNWRKYGFFNVSENVAIPNVNLIAMPGITLEWQLNKMNDENDESVAKLAARWASEVAPVSDFGGLIPQAVKGPLEVKMGRSTFTGREINPPGSEAQAARAPETVARPNTSKFSVETAKALKAVFGDTLTPPEIDHLIASYLGTAGREGVRNAGIEGTEEAADTPIVGRVFKRQSESQAVEDFYRLRELAKGGRRAQMTATDPAVAAQYATNPKAITFIDKMAQALDAQREAYKTAQSDEQRAKIAKSMREIAEQGIKVLKAIGADK